MVTGKNKEQFDKWLKKNYSHRAISKDNVIVNFCEVMLFNYTPFEMQIGVYIAYYDSLEVIVDNIKTDFNKRFNYSVYCENTKQEFHKDGVFNSRNEAYQEALKQADKLINDKL